MQDCFSSWLLQHNYNQAPGRSNINNGFRFHAKMQRQKMDVGCVERDCFPNLRKSALLRNCNKLLDTSYLRYQRRQTPGLVTIVNS